MKIWMWLTKKGYERLVKKGRLTAADIRRSKTAHEVQASLYIGRRMKQMGILPATHCNRPLLACFQQEGKKHLKLTDFENPDENILVAFEVPEERVLNFDARLYRYVECYEYIPEDENDMQRYEAVMDAAGINQRMLKSREDDRMQLLCMRRLLESSWERIFDLRKEDGYLYGVNSRKTIWSGVWEVTKEQVREVQYFYQAEVMTRSGEEWKMQPLAEAANI